MTEKEISLIPYALKDKYDNNNYLPLNQMLARAIVARDNHNMCFLYREGATFSAVIDETTGETPLDALVMCEKLELIDEALHRCTEAERVVYEQKRRTYLDKKAYPVISAYFDSPNAQNSNQVDQSSQNASPQGVASESEVTTIVFTDILSLEAIAAAICMRNDHQDNKTLSTILAYAIERGNIERACLLIQNSAQLDCMLDNGLTPLDYLPRCEHANLVKIVLNYCSDEQKAAYNQKNPIHKAEIAPAKAPASAVKLSANNFHQSAGVSAKRSTQATAAPQSRQASGCTIC